MNECEQSSRLGAYHDGEMSAQSRAEFERHLRQCPRCSAELDRARKLTNLFSSMPALEMPRAALEQLHRTVDLLPAAGICRMAEALAGVAAAILVACMIGLARQTPAQGKIGAMPVWETAAVTRQPSELAFGGTEELLASWMVQDLSWKVEHD